MFRVDGVGLKSHTSWVRRVRQQREVPVVAEMKVSKPSPNFQADPGGLYHTNATAMKLVYRPAAGSHAGLHIWQDRFTNIAPKPPLRGVC
jgi:hypothetical protein